ncbi:hypothetical protein HDU89_000083 [Geranomyces variabilis]|nr:hypothetical protein HDU89_000083 [Geranomyces variabilis]
MSQFANTHAHSQPQQHQQQNFDSDPLMPSSPQLPYDSLLFGSGVKSIAAPAMDGLSYSTAPTSPTDWARLDRAAAGEGYVTAGQLAAAADMAGMTNSSDGLAAGDWMTGLAAHQQQQSNDAVSQQQFEYQQQQPQYNSQQYSNNPANPHGGAALPSPGASMPAFLNRQMSYASSTSSIQPSPFINVISPEQTVSTPFDPYMSAHTAPLAGESPYFDPSYSAAGSASAADPLFSMEALLSGLQSPNTTPFPDTPAVPPTTAGYNSTSRETTPTGFSILDEVESELQVVNAIDGEQGVEHNIAMNKLMRALSAVRSRRGSSKFPLAANPMQQLQQQQHQQYQQQQQHRQQQQHMQQLDAFGMTSPVSVTVPEPSDHAAAAVSIDEPAAAGGAFSSLLAPLSFEALQPAPSRSQTQQPQPQGNPYPTPSGEATPYAAYISSPANPALYEPCDVAVTPAPSSFLSPYSVPVAPRMQQQAHSNSFLSPYSDAVGSPYSSVYDDSGAGGIYLTDPGYGVQQEDGLLDLMNILNSPLPQFKAEDGGDAGLMNEIGGNGASQNTAGLTPSGGRRLQPLGQHQQHQQKIRAVKPSISKPRRVGSAKRTGGGTTPRAAPIDPEAGVDGGNGNGSGNGNGGDAAAAMLPKLYPCTHPTCNKTFTRSYNLKSHSLLHTGVKPYPCSACNAMFLRKHDRDRHFNSLHGGAGGRKFKCTRCGAGFARADALRRHVEVEERVLGAGGNAGDVEMEMRQQQQQQQEEEEDQQQRRRDADEELVGDNGVPAAVC